MIHIQNSELSQPLEEFLFDFLLSAQLIFNLLVNDVPLESMLNLRTNQIQKFEDHFQIANKDVIYQLKYLDGDIIDLFQLRLDDPMGIGDSPLVDERNLKKIMRLAFPDSNILVLGTGNDLASV